MGVLQERTTRIARRIEAWTRSCIHPQDRAEIEAFDRGFRRKPGTWVLSFFAACAAVGVLVKATWPSLAWRDAALVSATAGMWFIFVAIPVYFGYRRFAMNPWKLVGGLVVLCLFGGAVGMGAGILARGKPLADVPLEKVIRALAVASMAGLGIGVVIVVITRVRLREAAQREALLAAEADRERLARQTVQAELRMLQAQVEPHFLFNTLANLRHLVQSGSGEALPMLDHLIRYLRTALPDIRSDSTTLGREAELARAYLEIMRMRMEDLSFAIEIPAEISGHAFPPLMLMTLVENAVKHGVAPRGRGEIRITASSEGDRIVVDVLDDGRGLGGAIGQGIGLANVRERLKALYGEAARLSMESTAPGGTRARLEMPA